MHRVRDRRLAAFVAAMSDVKAADAGNKVAAIDC
jgi:hypothetical protein